MSERMLNLVFAVAVLLLFAALALVTWGCVPACGGYEALSVEERAAWAAEQSRAAATVDAGLPERTAESGDITLTVTLEARR